jgi:hypothetical protein
MVAVFGVTKEVFDPAQNVVSTRASIEFLGRREDRGESMMAAMVGR